MRVTGHCPWRRRQVSSPPLWRDFVRSRQIAGFEIAFVGIEIFKIEEQALVMNEMRAGMPCRHVKFDNAGTANPKCRNPVEIRPRTVSQIVRRSDADKPILALHRSQTLAHTPMTRQLGKDKPVFLEVHDPQARRAVRQCQLWFFGARFRIIRVVVELTARSPWKNDLSVRRKRTRVDRLGFELGYGDCTHGLRAFSASVTNWTAKC